MGRNLAESFKAYGMKVVATGRSRAVADELKNQGIEFLNADILKQGQLNAVFSPSDCVIHCAGKSGDWGKYDEFYETNVVGTRNVVEACKTHRIGKLIFVSTPSIYYTGQDRFDVTEDEPLPKRPLTNYAKTKLEAERELMSRVKDGLKVIILRPRAVYGPHDKVFVPRILKMSERKQFPLINNGCALTDITYVDNFVEAVRKCLTAPDEAWNETYNISNGEPITMKDWFSRMLKILGRPFNPKNIPESSAKAVAGLMEFASGLPFGPKEPTLTRFSVGYMSKSMTMSIEKAKKKLGYMPRVNNRQSFEEYAKWYESKSDGI